MKKHLWLFIITALLLPVVGHSQPVAPPGLLKSRNLADLNDLPTARANLGLGAMALQNPAAVAITGGTIAGISTFSSTGNATLFSGGTNPLTFTPNNITASGPNALFVLQAAGNGAIQLKNTTSGIIARLLDTGVNNTTWLDVTGSGSTTGLVSLTAGGSATNRSLNLVPVGTGNIRAFGPFQANGLSLTQNIVAGGAPVASNTQILSAVGLSGTSTAAWGPVWIGYSDGVSGSGAGGEPFIFRFVDTLITGWQGSRQIGHFELNAFGTPGAGVNGGELNALSSISRISVSLGGTALTQGSGVGGIYGGSMNGVLLAGATNISLVAALNPQVIAVAGSSTVSKYGMLMGMGAADVVQGNLTDAAYAVASEDTALTAWRNVLSFGTSHTRNPFDANTTLIQGHRRQIATLETEITMLAAIDVQAFKFSDYITRAQNYGVDGTGRVFAAGLTTTGALQARTAGVASLALAAFGGLTGGSYPTFPTLVIQAPPAGGVQATAHVATVALTRAVLNTNGSGCTAGDTLTMTVATGTPGTIVLDTVDGGGAVLTYHIGAAGSMTAWDGSVVTTGGTCSVRPVFDEYVSILTTAIDAAGSGYGEKPPPRVFGVSGTSSPEIIPVVLNPTMSTTNGVLALNAAGGGLSMNGVAAVSCASGAVTAATVVVTNGVVTHC